MVVFHSYVSLPEGSLQYWDMQNHFVWWIQPPNDLWHWRFPFLSRSEIPMNKAVQFQSFPDLIIHDSHSHHSHHHLFNLFPISPIYWTIPHEILKSQNRFLARSWKAACVGSWLRRCCPCAWTWCRGRMDSGLWRIGISCLPSGKHTKSYWNIENGPVEIVDLAINSMVMFHSYVAVYQRVYGGKINGDLRNDEEMVNTSRNGQPKMVFQQKIWCPFFPASSYPLCILHAPETILDLGDETTYLGPCEGCVWYWGDGKS